MGRYKGQVSPKRIEQANPHWVDVAIPEGGLGRRLDEMYAWHQRRGLRALFGSAGLSVAQFCFSDPETADAFAIEFGGQRQGGERRPTLR